MKRTYFLLFVFFIFNGLIAQTPRSFTSSEILLQLKKLKVVGSVLYIAAHPDDENTRLLAYLSNEKLYRTAYLSLTRGDGGQNLIGDEQGVDLGLIRTQELLAARRVDGAQQFFSTAYDFGYSKSPDEALSIWGHDKILGDVVWAIRKFKPDVIICRFPTTGEGGHGHHTASAILAQEAFDAAADSSKFTDQFDFGVTPWKAKSLLWNTFNFGGTNTQKEDQFKLDVGGYNTLLGKSYGEIAAISRSQHKSQGFGVPSQRGISLEYFATIKGEKPVDDLMQNINTSWSRIGEISIANSIDTMINHYDISHPENTVESLVNLYKNVASIKNEFWKEEKLKQIKELIEKCSGLFLEAVSTTEYVAQGDSIQLTYTANDRLKSTLKSVKAVFNADTSYLTVSGVNQNITSTKKILLSDKFPVSQPYWLQEKMNKGSFNVKDPNQLCNNENQNLMADFILSLPGLDINIKKPIVFKTTDPVKGEIYQPVCVTYPLVTNFSKGNLVSTLKKNQHLKIELNAFRNISKSPMSLFVDTSLDDYSKNLVYKDSIQMQYGEKKDINITVDEGNSSIKLYLNNNTFNHQIKNITYDHIPSIHYFKEASISSKIIDCKISGKNIGYIVGAGDKMPEALMQVGYKITYLNENDILTIDLKQFDAIVTGVRAYNTNEWLNNVYEKLMDYIKGGGVLLVQYNTSNQLGPVKAKISPYAFNITRNRITDENAKVSILEPGNPVFNFPNKITENDFDGWIQERSIYHAETTDSAFHKLITMHDPGEKDHDGSLIVASYGKGKFIYTGISFFRQLPAGVTGAYRLFANLLAIQKK